MESNSDLKSKWAQRAEKVRAEELAATPRFYSPWIHLATTVGVTAAAAIFAALQLENVRLVEWLTIPATFLFANVFEWSVHKGILHHKFPGLTKLYEAHTPMHHSVYTPGDMVLRSTKEMRLVMMPALGIAAVVVVLVAMTPMLAILLGNNIAYLFLGTTTSYAALYEITHLLYHLDPDSFLGRLPGVAFLRQHHTVHHDPRIMQNWNFNVTVPLIDLIFGTSTKDANAAAAHDQQQRSNKQTKA